MVHMCNGCQPSKKWTHLTDLSSQRLQFIEPEPDSSLSLSTKPATDLIKWSGGAVIRRIHRGRYGGSTGTGDILSVESRYCVGYETTSRNQKQRDTIVPVEIDCSK